MPSYADVEQRSMGFTYVKIRVYNPGYKSRWRDVELLVDTGAIYSIIRKEILEDLGIRSTSVERLRTADGRVIERSYGVIGIEYMDEKAGTIAIFDEPGDIEVLGVHALEGLGLEVDPVTKKLRPATLLMV